MAVTLITGPVRSGKTRYALDLARAHAGPVTYLATAERDPSDPEWTERLRRHELERPPGWTTVETAGFGLERLRAEIVEARPDGCLVFDSLGTWLSARISQNVRDVEDDYAALERRLDADARSLASAFARAEAAIVVIAEEVGWDVTPAFPSGRLFRDVIGRAKQRLARQARTAYLVVSGYAVDLRSAGTLVPAYGTEDESGEGEGGT